MIATSEAANSDNGTSTSGGDGVGGGASGAPGPEPSDDGDSSSSGGGGGGGGCQGGSAPASGLMALAFVTLAWVTRRKLALER